MSDAVLISIISSITALLATGVAGYINYKLKKIETKIDGRLTQLLETTSKLANSVGNKEGREEMRQEQKSDKV